MNSLTANNINVVPYPTVGSNQQVSGSKTSEQINSTIIIKKISTQSTQTLEFISVDRLANVGEPVLKSAIKVYQAAFAREPYCELFDKEGVRSAFQYILDKKGDLIFGTVNNRTVALAGGYKVSNGTYFIEELAVSPKMQGNGYGRSIFKHLLEVIEQQNPARQEIRTTSKNTTAIRLYESCGFVKQSWFETVFQMRQNNKIELDERVYLSNPALSDEKRLMKLKRIAIASPCGNVTGIVYDKLLEADRKMLNQNIMDSWKKLQSTDPEIEQCCFITKAINPNALARVEMFGGEFCGNATRSAIWLITKGENYEGLIEVSGVSRPLKFTVKDKLVDLEMPLPIEGKLTEEVQEGVLVYLDGITHLVIDTQDIQSANPREVMESLLKENKYDCNSFPAFGVSCYSQKTGEAKFCVWVQAVDTIFDETACGSGTCSIGIAIAAKIKQSISLNVIQPSGSSIQTRSEYDEKNGIMQSFTTSDVQVLYDGEFELTC